MRQLDLRRARTLETRCRTCRTFRSAVCRSSLDSNLRVVLDFRSFLLSAHGSHVCSLSMQTSDTDDHLHNTPSRVSAELLGALIRDAPSMQILHAAAARYGNVARDSLNAEELVLDAIEDVLTGDAKCEPTTKLADLVLQVRRHVIRHARRHRNAPRSDTGKRPRPEEIPLEKSPPATLSVDPPQRLVGEVVRERPDPADLIAEWVAEVDEQAQRDEPLQQLLANFVRNGGRVLRRELLAGGMSKWTYREAKKRWDAIGAKAKHAVMARHIAPAADPEAGSTMPPRMTWYRR